MLSVSGAVSSLLQEAMPDMEDALLPLVATMVLGFAAAAATYKLKKHRHRHNANASNPMVALVSLSALGFVVLFAMRSVGLFDRAPFSLITAGLRNSAVVGCILFSVALAPLLDDIRHQYHHHSSR